MNYALTLLHHLKLKFYEELLVPEIVSQRHQQNVGLIQLALLPVLIVEGKCSGNVILYLAIKMHSTFYIKYYKMYSKIHSVYIYIRMYNTELIALHRLLVRPRKNNCL